MQVLRTFIMVGLFVPLQALSQDSVDCDNAITNSELTACTYNDYMKVDAVLNRVYKIIITSSGEYASKFRQAQIE